MAVRYAHERGILRFVLLAFAWTWAFWAPEAMTAIRFSVPAVLTPIGAWGPTVAAFVVMYLAEGRKGAIELAKRGVALGFDKRWLLLALFLYPMLTIGIVAFLAWNGPTPEFFWWSEPEILPVAFVYILLLSGPVQEEFGWRGYALDQLQARWSALTASVVLGVIWGVWHLPLFFMPSQAELYGQLHVGWFVLTTITLAIIHTWLHNHTRPSIFPNILLHASFTFSLFSFAIFETETRMLAFFLMQVGLTIGIVVIWGPQRLVRS